MAIRTLVAAQRFVWFSLRLLPPAGWQLAIVCSSVLAARLGGFVAVLKPQITLSISLRQLTYGKESVTDGK